MYRLNLSFIKLLLLLLVLVTAAVGQDDLKALRRIHKGSPSHLGIRDVTPSPEEFEPSQAVSFDYGNPEVGLTYVHTMKWWHDELHYVNLEAIEHYFKPQDRLCSRPDSSYNNATTLTIPFHSKETYELAKQFWQRDDLLFAIEDPSCVEGADTRSFYRPSEIIFSDNSHTVILPRARPVRSTRDRYDPDFAATFGWALDKVPDDVTHEKRSERLVPRGKWRDRFDKIKGKVHKGVDHAKHGTKTLFDEGKLSHAFTMSLGDKDYGPRHVLHAPSHPVAIGPAITCLNCAHKGEFTFTFAIDIDMRSNAAKGTYSDNKNEDRMKRHLKEVRLKLEVTKDVHIQHQEEIIGGASAEMACTINIWPESAFGCGRGVVVDGTYHQKARDLAKEKEETLRRGKEIKQPKFSKHGFDVMPFEANAIDLGFGFGVGGHLNLTTMGTVLKIPQGQSYTYNYLAPDKSVNTIDPEIELLPAAVHITGMDMHVNSWIGPQASINLNIPLENTGLGFGVKFEILKATFKVAEVASVDSNCNPTNPLTANQSVGVFVDLLSGPTAWIDFFGHFISTDWLGANPEYHMVGTQLVWHAFKKCWNFGPNGVDKFRDGILGDTINQGLNLWAQGVNFFTDPQGARHRNARWSQVHKETEAKERTLEVDPQDMHGLPGGED